MNTNRQRDDAVAIFDGQCEFCSVQATRLAGKGGRIRLRSLHDDGVLQNYPALTVDDCMEELKLVVDGQIFGGAEAVVRAAALRYTLGKLLYVYYIPGIRSLANMLYRWVASNRYRIAGRRREDCETGECKRHGSQH